MTLEQCERRNQNILENWKENKCIDSSMDLEILGSMLDVRIPKCVYQHFYHAEWDEERNSLVFHADGSLRTIIKVLNKLESKVR